MSTISPRPMHAPRPLEGFVPAFAWALRRGFGRRRFLVSLVLAALAGGALGRLAVPQGAFVTDDTRYYELWRLLDEQSITFLIPLAALVFVTQGFSREVSQRTLVYHLVRPIRRTTLYLAKFVAGVVPGVVVCIVGLFALALMTGVTLPTSLYVAIPAVSFVGVFSLGALYYLLATLFRHGMIAGLVYTFLIEQALGHGRGATANLSAAFHLRSLNRGLVNDDFRALSTRVADALDPAAKPVNREERLKDLLTALGETVYEPPTTAILVLVTAAAAMLLIGMWRVRVRDFPLKD